MRAHLEELLKPSGITALRYTALTVLEQHDGLPAAQLARRSFVTAQSTADMVRTLEQRGWVVTERNPESRRELQIRLTDAGRALLAEHADVSSRSSSGWWARSPSGRSTSSGPRWPKRGTRSRNSGTWKDQGREPPGGSRSPRGGCRTTSSHALGSRARRRLPRSNPRTRRDAFARRRPGLGERLGPGLRGGRLRGGGARRREACGGRRARALRDPDRAEGPVRRRREAPHRLEPGPGRGPRPGLRRLGEPLGRGHGPARASAHARVRLRRDHRPGRQPVVPRAFGRWLERRLGRRARIEPGARSDRHGHGRFPPHPVRGVRHVDRQAHARPALAPRDRAAGAELRPSWPHGPSRA